MTAARAFPSPTERNWLVAMGLVAAAVLLFWGIHLAEAAWSSSGMHERLVRHPVETSMRVLGIPHFVLGFLFMLTSRGMRRPGAWLRLLALAAVGAALCWAFAKAGGRAGDLSKALFLLYFAVHELRDEAFFYQANGDAPAGADPPRLRRDLLVAPAMLLWLAVGSIFLAIAWEIGRMRRYTDTVFGGTEPALRLALGALPLAALLGAMELRRRHHARGPAGGLWGHLRRHRPIFVVFAGIFALVVTDVLLHGRALALVTLHVTAWYVFARQQYARRPPPAPAPRRFTWRWMRTTGAGFAFLHVALAVVVLAGCAVWAFGFRNSPDRTVLRILFSPDAFAYWTIMHITLSFAPR